MNNFQLGHKTIQLQSGKIRNCFQIEGRMSASMPTTPPTLTDKAAAHDADMPADNKPPGRPASRLMITK
jgi:hypothetical protein